MLMNEQAADANESIQQLFYYNMFYYHAFEQDTKTTTPGVRKYYAANKFERLYNPIFRLRLQNTVLLTMLLREDHFCNSSFMRRYEAGQVKMMAALYDVSTIRKFWIVQTEGSHQVTR